MIYKEKHNYDHVTRLIDSLPQQLKMKFGAYVFEEKYSNLKFFMDKSIKFITAICPLMKADVYVEDEYIYRDGD